FFTSGHYVSIDLGGLNTHLDQFSGVSVMGNNAVNFVAVLDQDKTSINKDQMPTPPTTKPDITPPTITPPTNPTTPPSNIIVKPVIKENAYETT
ncbi:hypothetical protein BU975_09345, partial [Campylobacter jejuni]|nr:hypothetical protein [Campylobacter jejuni]